MRERRDVFDVAELQPRYTCGKCHSEITFKIPRVQEAEGGPRKTKSPPTPTANGLCLFCREKLVEVAVKIPGDGTRAGVEEAIAAYQKFYRLVVDNDLPIKLVAEGGLTFA